MEVFFITLKAAVALSSLTGTLAILIVIAEKYLANFGTCRIIINKEKELSVKGGGNLLGNLMDRQIFVPSACGGKGSCGYCKVRILSGGGSLLATEEPYISDEEKREGMRLSCCVKVRNDLEIELPAEILALREYTTKVESIKDLTYDTREIRLSLLEPETINFQAGQYVQFKIPPYRRSLEPVYRAYSMANPPLKKNALEFVVKLVPGGIATTYIVKHLKVGDTLLVNGPYGEFIIREDESEIIFVAGGTGIAPIKSMLETLVEGKKVCKITLFFGVVGEKDLFYMDILKEFEKKLQTFSFIPALSQKGADEEWEGEEGLITEVVNRYVEKGTRAGAYLCGSPGMIDACIPILYEKNIPQDKIFYDKFE